MEYQVLGPLEVLDDDEPVDIGSRQQRALLALLLLNANRVVSTERILEELWGDDVEGKEKTLWVYISRLRSALEPDREAHAKSSVLVTRDHGYALLAEPSDIDAHRFEEAADHGRSLVRDDPAAAGEELRDALAMWRGEAFEDFTYEEFVQAEIARLDELKLVATEDRIDADLRSGLHRDVIGELEALVRTHPLRERPVELLMIALYRAGRQADALRAFQDHTRIVGEELGIEPSPSLRRIEEQVLLHDPRLKPVDTPEPAADRLANPFKGLHAFSESDVATFFGRDRLVSDIVRQMSAGARLLTLVGASGSGKSSVLRAGVIPAIRKGALGEPETWRIAQMVPGARPFTELEAALLRSSLDAPDSLAELLDHASDGLLRAGLRVLPEGDSRLLLVIDQFEELFTLVDNEETRRRFIDNLEVALDDPHGRIVVVLALRADFYDRPLGYTRFASRLGEGVVNTVPLTPDELETAAEEPAAMVGVHIEPTLLARLLADVAGQSGGLPLFQYALTELFDRREGGVLTAGVYDEMGGVEGAITRRAEEIYEALSDDERTAAKQLFLRLVTIAGTGAWSRRRVPASEITSVAVDTVDLQTVLERFGSYRLLTFDRDHITGSPTVEVAHEALLSEWERLHEWIEDGREDVLRHARFVTALSEWVASGEKVDYLLSGERLADYHAWAQGSELRLSRPEQRFLDASIAHEEEQRAVEAERSARETKLDRQARRRLRGLAIGGAAFALVVIGVLVAVFAGGQPRIAVVHGPQGDSGVNDLMVAGAAGVEREDLTVERVEPLVDPEDDLRHLAETGTDLIIVSRDFDAAVEAVAPEFPDTHFVALDPVALHIDRPNITEMHFAVEESAFLAGWVAASTSETGAVGFIGGLQTLPVESSRTGFEQGVRFADRDVTVVSSYLGPVENPWATAEIQPDLGRELATSMFDSGVDVIFHDAGESGTGVLEAARAASSDRHRWVIGSDVDHWMTASTDIDRAHVLTSAIKRYDTAVVEAVDAYLAGNLESGDIVVGLREEGVGLSRRGGHLAGIDGPLKNLDGEVAFGHINVFDYSLSAPGWQRTPDVTIRLEMTETECAAEVSGPGQFVDGRVRVDRGTVVRFDYVNLTDGISGLSLRTIPPGVELDDLYEEAKAGIPASYEGMLAISFIEPGATTSTAAVMAGAPIVPNCFVEPFEDIPDDLPALILSPAA